MLLDMNNKFHFDMYLLHFLLRDEKNDLHMIFIHLGEGGEYDQVPRAVIWWEKESLTKQYTDVVEDNKGVVTIFRSPMEENK